MDLFLYYHVKLNERRPQEAWFDPWTMERATADHAAANLARMIEGLGRLIKRAALALVADWRGGLEVPARVAAKPAHFELTARNDDRAAA